MSELALSGLKDLHTRFAAAPEPALEDLIGRHEAEYAGPRWIRAVGPTTMRLTGMPGWWGKTFAAGSDPAVLEGANLVSRSGTIERSVPMTAQLQPSRVDGRLALVVSYPPDAPFPWRRVNDELRVVGDGILLGLTWGIPLGPGGGTPFVLHRRSAT